MRLFRPSMLLLFSAALALPACTQSPVGWWASVNQKAEQLSTLQARYDALEKSYAQLREKNYRQGSELEDLKARLANQELAGLTLGATGEAGRFPASVAYQVPRGLKPDQLRALAYEHLREKRFMESALTFEEFLHEPEAASLHDASDSYSAGVAWFEAGNLKRAKEDLQAASDNASGEHKDRIRKKVDLWMRVIDRRLAVKQTGGSHGPEE